MPARRYGDGAEVLGNSGYYKPIVTVELAVALLSRLRILLLTATAIAMSPQLLRLPSVGRRVVHLLLDGGSHVGRPGIDTRLPHRILRPTLAMGVTHAFCTHWDICCFR